MQDTLCIMHEIEEQGTHQLQDICYMNCSGQQADRNSQSFQVQIWAADSAQNSSVTGSEKTDGLIRDKSAAVTRLVDFCISQFTVNSAS